MRRNNPNIPFERYADDIIMHYRSEKQTRWIKSEVERRLSQCKLELHPEKTKIIYCKSGKRNYKCPNERFDFLGYTFRLRKVRSPEGKYFLGFIPAVSDRASRKMRHEMRSWKVHLRSDLSIEALSRFCNPTLRGWINYYGQYYKSSLYWTFNVFNRVLARRAMRKYKGVERPPPEGSTLAGTDNLSSVTVVRTLAGGLSTTGWTIGAG
jgi:RNA-directed DNA polymerase